MQYQVGVGDGRQRGFAGDKLYFDGYDLGQDRTSRRAVYDEGYDDFNSDNSGFLDPRGAVYQHVDRTRESALVQSALDRIAQARVSGRTNVNLSREEMEALEHRGTQRSEPQTALALPPSTPAKVKVKSASRNSSNSSLNAQKTRKRSTSGIFSSSARSSPKAKGTKKISPEHDAALYQAATGAPGIMVPGPNGVPVFAPLGYYGPPSPEYSRSQSRGSRSSSIHSLREATPPEQLQAPPSRYYRPDSQQSLRSQPDDTEWYPPSTRHRSTSNLQAPGYRHPDDYEVGPLGPPAQGRQHAGGPSDVRYASLRRAPPSSSPLAQRASPANAGASALRRVDTSSSSSSEGQGVQVDIVPDENGGYSIRSSSGAHPAKLAPSPIPAAASPGKANETGSARKRRTGRR